MNIPSHLRISLFLLFAVACTGFAQTVREQMKDPEFKLYSVIFGITIDADSKILAFKVSKVIEPKSGKPDAVDVQVPQAYVDAARKKAEAKGFPPKMKDGKPVEFFTYFLYAPEAPATVISDLDQPLDKQP